MTGARAVAAHTARVRQAGGKRTSVDLTAEALADLQALREGRSISETINHALRIAANARQAEPVSPNARLGTAK